MAKVGDAPGPGLKGSAKPLEKIKQIEQRQIQILKAIAAKALKRKRRGSDVLGA